MKRLAAILLLCSPAWAQETVSAGGDTIAIRETDRGLAEVIYSNSLNANSQPGTHTLRLPATETRPEVVVVVEVSIGGADHGHNELVTIRPADPGLVAYPSEGSVPDGELLSVIVAFPAS